MSAFRFVSPSLALARFSQLLRYADKGIVNIIYT